MIRTPFPAFVPSTAVRVFLGAVLLGVAAAPPAVAQNPVRSIGRPILENQSVTVRDIRLQAGIDVPRRGREQLVLVYLEGRSVGEVEFVGPEDQPAAVQGDEHAVLVELEDRAMARYDRPADVPLAFPRPGAKLVVDNDRVSVWDYTFAKDVPSPLHFHDKDVVVVFLGDGALASTTPDGAVTVTDHTNGVTRFNPGNRLHTETLARGSCRVIVIELK